MAISNRLKDLRKQWGLSQVEVAKSLSITRQAYNHYERGKREPSLNTVHQLSLFYNVSIDYLLDVTDRACNFLNAINCDLPKRLIELREKTGLSTKVVAHDLSISQSAYDRYELGICGPNHEMLSRMAEYFNVPVDYLLGLTDKSVPCKDDSEDEYALPIIGTVSASGNVIAFRDDLGSKRTDKKYDRDTHFFLKVKGDSMSPEIDEGDLVLVRKQPILDNGNIGVVIIDEDEGVVKKIRHNYDNEQLELISFNRYYPLRIFKGREMERVRIVGKVLLSEKEW